MSTSKNKKSTNPLYVVRKNGVDVEEASGILELILKKTGLDKMIPILESFVQILLAQVESYAMFIETKKIIDQVFNKVIEIIFQIQQMTQKKKV
ncbi:MAG: hypothetical protein H7281_01855 [Bacteriovorax sp.]|nr:hypothetical protein [Bacteriovorax sp.]